MIPAPPDGPPVRIVRDHCEKPIKMQTVKLYADVSLRWFTRPLLYVFVILTLGYADVPRWLVRVCTKTNVRSEAA